MSGMQQAVAAGRSRPVPSLRRSQGRLTADSFCVHRIIEDPEWSLAAVPRLTELCLQHIAHNFTRKREGELLPRGVWEQRASKAQRQPEGTVWYPAQRSSGGNTSPGS